MRSSFARRHITPYILSGKLDLHNSTHTRGGTAMVISTDETFLWVGEHNVDERFHAKYRDSAHGMMRHEDG